MAIPPLLFKLKALWVWPPPPEWPVWPYPAPSKAKQAKADLPTIDFGERVPAHLKSKWKAYVWNHGSEDAR